MDKSLYPLLSFKKIHIFLGGMIVYALWGSPTPDNPGIMEYIMAICFVSSLGLAGFLFPMTAWKQVMYQPLWVVSGLILFVYGAICPLLVAVYSGYPVSSIIRDCIGFGFLCLPLFFYGAFIQKKNISTDESNFIIIGCIVIGLCFSIRVLFQNFSFFTPKEELLYLANSPLVLFSTIWIALSGFEYVRRSSKIVFDFLRFIFCALAVAILLSSMFIDFQRASFVALFISIGAYVVWGGTRTPLRMIIPIALLIAIAFVFHNQILDVGQILVSKTSQVGLNMRAQEGQAVIDMVNKSPLSLFLGYGWGARFESPAVGGLPVYYTHSLLSYMLLKTGVIGLGLTLVYLFFMFEKILRLVFSETVRGLALLWPFVIAVTLYASYKSLDFGLVLTLIMIMSLKTTYKEIV